MMIQKFFLFLLLVVIPVVAIVLRFKKKLSTMVTIMMVASSILVSIIVFDTFKADPVDTFMTLINQKKTREARRAYKVLVQYGPEYLDQIDEDKIAYKSQYATIRQDLVLEYLTLSKKMLVEYGKKRPNSCDFIKDIEHDIDYLNHSKKLYNYASSIGGADSALQETIEEAMIQKEEALKILKDTCSK